MEIKQPMTGYAQICVEPKKIKAVLEAIRAKSFVTEANAVTGPFDILAQIEAQDMDTMAGYHDELKAIDGVTSFTTGFVIE